MQPPALPDPPSPMPGNQSALWERVEQLPRGEKIKVRSERGPWERCRFAGANDEALFCGPRDDFYQVQGYPIARANIFDVKVDHDERNGRLVFTAFVLAGAGAWAGIAGSRTSDSGTIIFAGLLGAGIGAIVGMPASCISGHCVTMPYPPTGYRFGYNLPLRRIPRHSW